MVIYADNKKEGQISYMLVKTKYSTRFCYLIYKDGYFVELPVW